MPPKVIMKESHKGKHVGSKNSQFGTMWITNGVENKKITKTDTIPEEWYNGRNLMPLWRNWGPRQIN